MTATETEKQSGIQNSKFKIQMASSSSDMKGFFREKKKSAKPNKSGKPIKSAKPKHSASCGSDVVQPPALLSHGSPDLQDEYDEEEMILRQFDMNMAYGPCLGMSRLGRWERANALGLHPPQQVQNLLMESKVNNSECLWDGRV